MHILSACLIRSQELKTLLPPQHFVRWTINVAQLS